MINNGATQHKYTYVSLIGLSGGLQASPTPSWSVSCWSGFDVLGQLSQASPTVSDSLSSCPGLTVKGQLSAMSSWPVITISRVTFYLLCAIKWLDKHKLALLATSNNVSVQQSTKTVLFKIYSIFVGMLTKYIQLKHKSFEDVI